MTREGAYAQYSGLVRELQSTTGAKLDGWENDFNGWWNNASRDSGAYQSGPNGTTFAGSIYDRTWEQVWPEASAVLYARAANTNTRTVDSQSTAGNLLYGSGTGNALNIPGAPLVQSPYVPLTPTGAVAVPATQAPAVGPTGLAYAADPVNYSNMAQGEQFGYTTGDPELALRSGLWGGGGGSYSSGYAPAAVIDGGGGGGLFGGGNTMTYVLLAAAALGAFLLLRK